MSADCSFRTTPPKRLGYPDQAFEMGEQALRSQGKRDVARVILAPVDDWFTEGFDTADLKDAKALLEELA